MGIIMPITNVYTLRKDLLNSINSVVEYNEIITVVTNKGNAVIVSEEEYNAMFETIFLISQTDVVDKIKQGEKEEIDNMSTYSYDEEW